ncbi:MAG: STAS domain-containing protein, partial [Planctomycetota bacterium]
MQYDLAVRAETPKNRVAAIRLGGVVDAHTLDKFDRALTAAVKKDVRSIILDCEELRYVNSSGFGELIRYSDVLRERGGTLVLARVPPKVAIILEMLGLKKLIPTAASLEEAQRAAERPVVPPPATAAPEPPGATAGRFAVPPPRPAGLERVPSRPASGRIPAAFPAPAAAPAPAKPAAVDGATVLCALCDARVRITGQGRWLCPSCGAPFTLSPEGGIAFDWTEADADAMHLTFDVAPRSLAAFAGVLEGVLTERRVSHARTRRFSREAAHVCHLICEHAYGSGRPGPLHVLVLA